jgi:predicted AAA+ superfamily ATPase
VEETIRAIVPRPLYLERLEKLLDTPPVKVVTGMRRVGKSTILRSVAAQLRARGVAGQNILTYNFESMALAPLASAEALYQDVRRRAGSTQGRVYLLLDEVQEVAGWERAVASFLVDLDCDVIVTGSSATLLASELATKLTGRYIEIRVWPLSFAEFLAFRAGDAGGGDRRGDRHGDTQSQDDAASAAPGAPIWDYLRFGGMPGLHEFPADAEACEAYLRDVFNSVLLSDVVARHSLRDIDLLNRLVAFAASNLGQTFSANSISRFLKSQGRALGSETVYRYLRHLSEAFAVHRVARAEVKGKRLLETQEKYFFEDHALRHALLGYDQRELPGVLENVVFSELARRGYTVRVGRLPAGEIDFMAEKAGQTLYVQVAYLLADPAVEQREFAPLAAVPDNYPKMVVSMDAGPPYTIAGIRRLPLPEFLLATDW